MGTVCAAQEVPDPLLVTLLHAVSSCLSGAAHGLSALSSGDAGSLLLVQESSGDTFLAQPSYGAQLNSVVRMGLTCCGDRGSDRSRRQ